MQVVYWAHSYRAEDAAVNRHFGMLIETAEQMIVNFDPPSSSVSEAKLQQNRRSCDGMVAVLTWRAGGPSPYILFEIVMALRARMPVVVFVDDRLPGDLLPPRVLQQRFSHRTYFRQIREHRHALRALKAYMGEPPPTRYQANFGQRCCGTIGLSGPDLARREQVETLVRARGYRVLALDELDTANPLALIQEEALAAADVVLRSADSQTATSRFWAGAVWATATPAIAFTLDASHVFHTGFPREFQPQPADCHGARPLDVVLCEQFDLYEQTFLSTQESEVIERYVQVQLRAGALAGRYDERTRDVYIGAIMGDQYHISGQAGAVGPNAHAHDINFNQAWAQMAGKPDLAALADELQRLRTAMAAEAVAPEQHAAGGNVAAAEASARQGDGPSTLKYLKSAGKWALGVAEKIGVDLAKDALKGTLGL